MEDHSPRERYGSAAANCMRSAYADARVEALRRGDRKIGTEHLALAVLRDPMCAHALGRTVEDGRAALESLDQDALKAVGIEASACTAPPIIPTGSRERLPLTPTAKSALHNAAKAAGRRIVSGHILCALLSRERPDSAAELMAKLGVDTQAVRAQLGDLLDTAARSPVDLI